MPRYEIDLTRFLEDRATFWTLSISAPPGERSVAAEARGLGIELPAEALRVIRDGSKFVALPRDVTKAFADISSRARRTFAGYGLEFPFLPATVIAVDKARDAAFQSDMSALYDEFEAAKSVLVDRLPALEDERREAFRAAGEAVYNARTPRDADGRVISRADFGARWEKAFSRAFPRAADVRKHYRFRLEAVGTIRKTLALATREDFLADEQTAAKVAAIRASEDALKAEFYSFAAAAATNLRLGLLRALEPTVAGMSRASLGKRELDRIERVLADVAGQDMFGDKSLADVLASVRRATDTLRAGVSGVEAARAARALQTRLDAVKDELAANTFDPADFRKLELDGDGAEVFADRDVIAEIRERMAARVAEATAELATNAGGTPDEIRAREDRLRLEVGLAKLADGGADEATLDLATRAMTLETGDGPETGPAADPVEPRVGLELDGDGGEVAPLGTADPVEVRVGIEV